MSKVSIAGDSSGTGTFTIKSPNSNTDRVLTLPDASGTVQVSGAAISGTTGTFSGTISGGSTVGVGGATPSASGAGITFPATQSASTDANTLDDYEEGTWTPVPTFGGGNTGMVYSSLGSYTKIGRLVHLRGEFAISTNGSSTGTVRLGGLPFTPNASQFIGGMIGDGFTFTGAQLNAVLEAGRTDITAVIQAGGTGSLGGWTYMQNTAIASGSKYFELVYYV
jgi:hypothetical protein